MKNKLIESRCDKAKKNYICNFSGENIKAGEKYIRKKYIKHDGSGFITERVHVRFEKASNFKLSLLKIRKLFY